MNNHSVKICSKCGESKEYSLFYKRAAAKDGLQNRSKQCQDQDRDVRKTTNAYKATMKKWRQANGDKVKLSSDKWRNLNPGKAEKWQLDNPERFKKYQKAHRKQQSEALADSYVRRLIYKQTKIFDSPEPLIKAVRAHLQITRFLKKASK